MKREGESDTSVPSGVSLRTELALRNLRLAAEQSFLHHRTDGQTPSVIFGRDANGRHGNFHARSYDSICADPAWAKRLEKTHTAYKRARARADWQWKELDCANSSDALLMNIFCHPETMQNRRLHALLGVEADATPTFGFKPRTPLLGNRADNTEIDMKLGDLLVEAKLTESDFQSARLALLTRYRNFNLVFDESELPSKNGRYMGYQLIRGALAAHATGCSFCVCCDARRADLMEAWYRIVRSVRLFELRSRLKMLTWQEIAMALPKDLQGFCWRSTAYVRRNN